VNGINLIPAPRRRSQVAQTHLRRWVAGWVFSGLALLVGCLLIRATWGGARSALAEDIDKAARTISVSNRQVDILRRRLADARWKLESGRAVGQQPDWSILLALLAGSLGDDVVLERCQLAPADPLPTGGSADAETPDTDAMASGRYVFEIDGLSRSQLAVSRFVLRLEKTGLFDQIRLIKTTRRTFLDQKAVAFRLECLLQGTSAPER